MRHLAAALLAIALAACGEQASETGSFTFTATERADATVEATAQAAAMCQPAPEALVAAIEEGLTVDGGGALEKARVVEVPEEKRNGEGWPVYIVGSTITGPGMDGVVGTWATDEEAGPIFALNTMAREFSDWGAAAQDGSAMAEIRDSLAGYDEASAVEDCAARS